LYVLVAAPIWGLRSALPTAVAIAASIAAFADGIYVNMDGFVG
jgi:hypothetical protein